MTLWSPPLESIVTAIGWSLIHSLWLGVFVAACAWIVVSMLRGATAQSRYVVLLLALVSIPVVAIACTSLMHDDRIAASAAIQPPMHHDMEAAWPETSPDDTAPVIQVVGNRQLSAELPLVESQVGAEGAHAAVAIARPRQSSTDWISFVPDVAIYLPWLVCIWMAGVAVLSTRMLLGCVSLRRMLSSGTPVSQEIVDMATRLSRGIHLNRTLRVVESTLAEAPATIGFFRPLILLPFSVLSSLSTKELEAILAHELAHIHRGDFLVNVFQTLVDILLFYHPAVWWISRRIRQEREHACDDLAIGVTGNRLQYARALATVAEQAMHNQLAMPANGGQFSMRIRRILGQNNARQPSSLYVVTAGALATILLGVTLFLSHPTESTAGDGETDTKQNGDAERLEPISGVALGPDKRPLSGVTVYLRRRPFRYHEQPIELAEVTTDDDGQFKFHDVELSKITDRYQKSVFPVDVIATKPGYSIRWQRLTNSQTGLSLQLKQETQFSGVLKDDAGDPVAGATIRVQNLMSLNTLTKIDVAGGHTPSQNGDSFLDISQFVASNVAETGQDGRFVLRGLPARVGIVLAVDDDRFVDRTLYAATTDEKLADIPAGELIFPPRPKTVGQIMQRRVQAELVPIHTTGAEIEVDRGEHVLIRVVDDATGDPIAGATATLRDGPSANVLTDDKGVGSFYRLKPGSELPLSVRPPESFDLLGWTAAISLSDDLQVEREVRLKRGAIVSGRVIDRDSRAGVPNATVSFVPAVGDVAKSVVPAQTTSGPAGDFRLVVPEASGRVVVSRTPPGYLRPRAPATGGQEQQHAASIVTASLGEPIEGIEFPIERRQPIPIVFVDTNGKPLVVTADVRVFSSSNSYSNSTVEVDESGKMDVSLLVKSPELPMAIQILARSADKRLAGFFRSKKIEELQGGDAHPIVLRPTAVVHGQIFNKETSTPISGARVSLSVSYTATGGQGVASFTCDKEGGYEFGDLVPGMQYSLGVTADGHMGLNSIHTRFVANDSETHVVDIVLLPEKPEPIADLKPVEAPLVEDLAPEKVYEVLASQYTKSFAAYRDLLKKHSSSQIRSQIVSLREPTPVYAAAFMELANGNPGTAVELKSLKWLCKAHRIAGTEQRHAHLRTEAATRLLKDYSDRREIADAVSEIIYSSPGRYDAAQRLMKSSHHEVQGRATFACANIVAQRFEDPYRGGHDVLRDEAIELFQKVVDEYSEITRWGNESLGEHAKDKLFELKELQIGATAPDIVGVDLDGKPMKLSDFCDKVVVIHYWRSSLMFCSELKGISEEYKGKPLVIVGVNTDEDRTKAIVAAEQQGLAIRHWHDPKREIHARWSGSWPDTHVISHDSKILYRGQRRSSKPLEDVIDQAVKAAQEDASKAEREDLPR